VTVPCSPIRDCLFGFYHIVKLPDCAKGTIRAISIFAHRGRTPAPRHAVRRAFDDPPDPSRTANLHIHVHI
jgi:hypothetical protein